MDLGYSSTTPTHPYGADAAGKHASMLNTRPKHAFDGSTD
jgi:hypothetical protein